MRIKSEVLGMHNFIGGMVGWIAFQKTGFEKAFYVWDADTAGEDPNDTDTVLMKKNYLSIRTDSKDREYINAIATNLLGKPYSFIIEHNKKDGIWQVRREHIK